jgi:dienelactone hydrolase
VYADDYMRFLPGRRGESTACLIAGPFSSPVSELEDSDYSSIASRERVPGRNVRWEQYNTASGLIDLSRYSAGKNKKKYIYLYTCIFSEKEQDGIFLFTSNNPSILKNGKIEILSKINPRNNQHMALSTHRYLKGRNKFLVRVNVENSNPAGAILLGSFRSGKAGLLKKYSIEIPGRPSSDKQLNQLLLKSSALEINPVLAGISDKCTFAFKLLPGAPVPVGPASAILRIKGSDGSIVTETLGSDLILKDFTKGVVKEFDIAKSAGRQPLVFELMIKRGNSIFAALVKKYYTSSSLKRIIFDQQNETSALEKNSRRGYAMSRLALLSLRGIYADLTDSFSTKSFRMIDRFTDSLDRIKIYNSLYASGIDPLRDKKGLISGAYISKIDDSVQPFRLYIPHSVTPDDYKNGIPLVVLYHGYVPSYTRVSWRSISAREISALEQSKTALLLTFGRSNTDFLNVGERDTFAALEVVKNLYKIDSKRIYLAGYSMGGSGAWTTLCHYPGIFAASHIWSGRTDYYYWHNLKRQELPSFIRILINTDNPVDLSENLNNTPLFVDHPKNDTLVKAGHSSLINKKLLANQRKAPVQINLPERGTHWYFSRALEDPETYRNLLKFTLPEASGSISIAAYSVKYGKNEWLSIDCIKEWGKRAVLKAEYKSGINRIIINDASNVAAFSVNLNRLKRTKAGKVPDITFCNKKLSNAFIRKGIIGGLQSYVIVEFKQLLPSHRTKSSSLCGPLKEVFCSPFMVVLGTSGSNEQNQNNVSIKDIFIDEWKRFAKGNARLKTDVMLNESDIKSYNLICIGGALSNSFVKKNAAYLPFKFTRQGYGIADDFVEKGTEKLGFAGCFPNPDPSAAGRLLVILDGIMYGSYLPINHKWDFVPDFIIFRDKKWERDTNYPEIAGFFNSVWKYDKSLIFKPDKQSIR